MAAPVQQRRGFFDFPAEVRISIYRVVFPEGGIITPASTIADFGEGYNYPTRVLRTSRVFDSEAGIIFYGSSIFRFASAGIAIRFIKLSGPSHSSLIRRVQLGDPFVQRSLIINGRELSPGHNPRATFGQTPPTIADFIIRPCPNLRSLVIEDFYFYKGKEETQYKVVCDIKTWMASVPTSHMAVFLVHNKGNAICIQDKEEEVKGSDFTLVDIALEKACLAAELQDKRAAARAKAIATKQAKQAARDAEFQAQAQAQARAQVQAEARGRAEAEAQVRAGQDKLYLAAQRFQQWGL